MTTIYFVRHAEPNLMNHEDLTRELSPKGLNDRVKVTSMLENIKIEAVYSSPYKRTVDTIKPYADKFNLNINIIENLKERNVGSWLEDFDSFVEKQWEDFDYKLESGESLREVQNRNIKVIEKLIKIHPKRNIVIAGHGTAISSVVNYFNDSFSIEDFRKIKNQMPFILKMNFDEKGKYINYSFLDFK